MDRQGFVGAKADLGAEADEQPPSLVSLRLLCRRYAAQDGGGEEEVTSSLIRQANSIQRMVLLQLVEDLRPSTAEGTPMSDFDWCRFEGVHAILVDAAPDQLAHELQRMRGEVDASVALIAVVSPLVGRDVCLTCMAAGADALLRRPLTADALADIWQPCLRRNPRLFSQAAGLGDAAGGLAGEARSSPAPPFSSLITATRHPAIKPDASPHASPVSTSSASEVSRPPLLSSSAVLLCHS